MQEPHVVHEPDLDRYELLLGEERIGVLDYRRQGDGVVFTHVEVLPAHRNQGHAEQLTREALDDAQRHGLPISARCPYVAAYLRRHPAAA
jgi:predicted GNAT family acetyltransferase